jgi:glucose/arabinose dehydrogenase
MKLAAVTKHTDQNPPSDDLSWPCGMQTHGGLAKHITRFSTRRASGVNIKHLLAAGALISVCALPAATAELDANKVDVNASTSQDWKEQWALPEGFSISIDTEGYHYPTAIAFVPNPDDDPKDPLYFVTELRGKVKVVTNDRTVHTFADGFLQTEFYEEIPHGVSEFGLAGICLEPKRGYVFITFAYQDDDKTLRNNIIRFTTTPGTFSIKPNSQRAFTDVFAHYEAGPSHQIGPCAVHDGMLYAGVGDGFKSPLGSQRLDVLLGKIIRMNLDGKPVPANPFYVDDDIRKARNYVWAYGLRNPFSLEIVRGDVIVAENGPQIDRFVEVRQGQNYLWDGTTESIATNAAYVFLDSIGPTQMDYYPATPSAFPEAYANQLYLAYSGDGGIVRLRYGFEDHRLLAAPEPVVQPAGDGAQPIVGMGLGPDGLYFAPLLPVTDGKAAVLKVRYEPKEAHPITLAQLANSAELGADIKELMRAKGCFGCHRLTGVFELGGAQGPLLDQGDGPMVERIQHRIGSKEYLQYLQELNAREQQLSKPYERWRQEVAEAQGLERVRLWMKYQILEPQFDGPSTMPDLGLTEAEAEAITRFLLVEAGGKGIKERVRDLLPEPTYRNLVYAFGTGVIVGLPIWLALRWFGLLWTRRRHG